MKAWRMPEAPQPLPRATPVFLPGKFHGQRSLVGYCPWGHKELVMTERLHFHFFFSPLSVLPLVVLEKAMAPHSRDRKSVV